MASLNWKKRKTADRGLHYHVSVAQMEHIKKQLAEDEAWLLANMRSDAKRKREAAQPAS